jgi:molybdate transport system permease protein
MPPLLSMPDKASSTEPVESWSGKWFAAVAYFFVGLFTIFILGLILGDAMYVNGEAIDYIRRSNFIVDSLWLSLWTSTLTTLIAVAFAIPVGYALSRYRFPGQSIADTLVDLPIVFPPLVAGLTLLVFFHQTTIGQWIQSEEHLGLAFAFQPRGIVLCQFFVSASFAIRSAKVAFDGVDRRLENVALTLGCTRATGFRRVTLPLAKPGIIAGAVLTWARAFGIFGPLLIFVGSFRGRTEVLSTTIYLEQGLGETEVAIAIALLLISVAFVALFVIRRFGGSAMPKL